MASRETTVAASVVTDMLQYLAERGVSTSDALAASGIDATFPVSSDDRVAGSKVERLWRIAIERTGDTVIGLHMAETYNPGALDILGYVILSCRTVGEVLEKFARYARLLNDGMRVEMIRERRVAFCRCTFVEGVDNYLLRAPEQAIDATWGGVARELRRLAVLPLTAQAVWFRHAPPRAADLAEYERVIGAPLRFGAPEDRFIVPTSHLEQPLRSANPALLHVFEQHAEASLGAVEREESRANQVARLLSQKLRGSVPALEDIARELAMSARNLQRSLREAGTSYQTLLDEVRRDLAIRHLANPATSTGQVGFLLGFSEPSAFHRAFRRWTGKAPSAFRSPRLPFARPD
jgi:AraC-like DNA-binding protein